MRKVLVCVHWIDADGEAGWFADDPKEDSPHVLRTYGLLVRQTDDWVITASTYDPLTGLWSDRSRIPMGMVQKVETIRTVTYG